MPLLQKIEENDCQIAIWDMSESLDALIESSSSLELSKFKTEKRKKEFLEIKLSAILL